MSEPRANQEESADLQEFRALCAAITNKDAIRACLLVLSNAAVSTG